MRFSLVVSISRLCLRLSAGLNTKRRTRYKDECAPWFHFIWGESSPAQSLNAAESSADTETNPLETECRLLSAAALGRHFRSCCPDRLSAGDRSSLGAIAARVLFSDQRLFPICSYHSVCDATKLCQACFPQFNILLSRAFQRPTPPDFTKTRTRKRNPPLSKSAFWAIIRCLLICTR